uniref:Tektin n=1 Tax=Rousettus aegyptiacus TaxID=9407 RepID=A0A7J8KI94_ROUAE|nr:tektin 2 [Rousettus aegyptiacus]
MATLSVKPSQRFQLPDWHTNSYLLSTNAERQRDASHQIRQEARILRNETNNQTIWDEHDNRTRLEERVDTVNRWKETLDIDRGCLSLNLKSPNISLKINPTRVPDGSSTLQQWDDFSQFSKNRAEAEMKEAVELREAIALTIAETNNELEAQRVATEFAFRKRLREMEKVYSELKWQEKNTLEEITELQKDIQHLEDDLRRKFMNLKLCHTRLESRTYRPNVELCRDQAQYGLTDEVHQLEATIAALKQKLAQAQDALDALYKHLARLQADIACKANSMLLDTKCMDTRRKLTVPAEKFVPEVDTFTRTTNRTLSPLKSCQLELA